MRLLTCEAESTLSAAETLLVRQARCLWLGGRPTEEARRGTSDPLSILSASESTVAPEGTWLSGLLWLLEEGGLGSLELGLGLLSAEDTTASSERVIGLLSAGAREETACAPAATCPECTGSLGAAESGGAWLLACEGGG